MATVNHQTIQRKLRILADAAKYDASCASSGSKRKNSGGMGNTEGMGICHSYAPDGRCISLLKVLLTNFCIYDCAYCVNRISSDVPRETFSVDEVVSLTLEFYRRNYIEGLFLSSGVKTNPDDTMEKMIQVVRKLREDHKFGGYLHVKAVAGASTELSAQVGLWADRVSANIELPRAQDLSKLAPAKTHAEVETVFQKVKEETDLRLPSRFSKSRQIYAPGGQSTQMIVGATEASDASILTKSQSLYKGFRLRRVYYTGYTPVDRPDLLLPSQAPPLLREHRLYQADWLLRFYGFEVGELADSKDPNLSLEFDPKLAWALKHRECFPVDVNRAPKEMLLRIPGFGVRVVKRIIQARRFRQLSLADLKRLGGSLKRAKFFIETARGNPSLRSLESSSLSSLLKPPPKQLDLFDSVQSAVTGEV